MVWVLIVPLDAALLVAARRVPPLGCDSGEGLFTEKRRRRCALPAQSKIAMGLLAFWEFAGANGSEMELGREVLRDGARPEIGIGLTLRR